MNVNGAVTVIFSVINKLMRNMYEYTGIRLQKCLFVFILLMIFVIFKHPPGKNQMMGNFIAIGDNTCVNSKRFSHR